MTELRAVSGFDDLLHPVGSGAGLTVTDLDGIGIASVQAFKRRTEAVAAALAAADASIRATANGRAAMGIGPGRWLVTQPGAANSLAPELEATLGALASVNDQSDGYAVLRITGPRVRDILARGVNIDLHDTAFPVGKAAATGIAHIGVTLWRCDNVDGLAVFEIALFRSMAGSFMHWLEASAGAFGLAVSPPILRRD
jgi:sarcosine oxidase subunit gamma